MHLPGDIVFEILSHLLLPMERLLSRQLNREYGERLTAIRLQRVNGLTYNEIGQLVKDGNLELLQGWFYADSRNLSMMKDYPEIAAKWHRLPILKWLYRIGFSCTSDSIIELSSDHFLTIKWLHSIGIHPNQLLLNDRIRFQLVKYLYSINADFDYQELAYHSIPRDDVAVLKWIRSKKIDLDYNALSCEAVGYGSVGVLRWMRSIGINLNYYKLRNIAMTWNQEDVVYWIASVSKFELVGRI